MDENKPKKIPGTGRGTGRKPGSKGKRTAEMKLIGKSVSEFFQNVLGIDDAAVERTGQISRRGYAGREKYEAMINGGRPVDIPWLTAFKLGLQYGYGIPGKMVMQTGPQRSPVIFVGKPWDPENPINRAMDARSAQMIVAKDEQLALEAADRAAQAAAETVIEHGPAQPESEDTLERVVPPPAEDPSAYR